MGDELERMGRQMDTTRNKLVSAFLPEMRALASAAESSASWISRVMADVHTLPGLLRAERGGEQRDELLPPPPPKPPAPPPREDPENTIEHARRSAEAFARQIDQLRKSSADSAFATAALVLDEFQNARTQAARTLSETMARIEASEAQAVEAAKGSAEKIRLARETAQQAELAALTRFEAEKTSITEREAEKRADTERKRAESLDRFLAAVPGDTAEGSGTVETAKAAALDLEGILTTGLGGALESFSHGAVFAFEEFIAGAKSGSDAIQGFAAQMLKSMGEVIAQLLVMAAVQKLAGFFAPAASGATASYLAYLDTFLASGGVVTRPTLAVIGEGGEPEAVVPLSKASQMGFGGGEISVTTIVNVNGAGGLTAQTTSQGQGQAGLSLARAVKTAVIDEIRNQQRSGGLLATTGGR